MTKMNTNFTLTIQHPEMGLLTTETYVDATQFKLLLKMVQGCLELNNDLTYFDGMHHLIHIPSNILKQSVVTTKSMQYTAVDHLKTKTI